MIELLPYFFVVFVASNILLIVMAFQYGIGWGFACIFIPFSGFFLATDYPKAWLPVLIKCIIVLSYFGTCNLENTYKAYIANSTEEEIIFDGVSMSFLKKINFPEFKNIIGLMDRSCFTYKTETNEKEVTNTKEIDSFYFPIKPKNNPLQIQDLEVIIKTKKYTRLEDLPREIKEFDSIKGLNYEFNLKMKKTETETLKSCYKEFTNENYILINMDEEKPSLIESIIYLIINLILVGFCVILFYKFFIKKK